MTTFLRKRNVRAKKCSLILGKKSHKKHEKTRCLLLGVGRIAQSTLPLLTDCTTNKAIPRVLTSMFGVDSCGEISLEMESTYHKKTTRYKTSVPKDGVLPNDIFKEKNEWTKRECMWDPLGCRPQSKGNRHPLSRANVEETNAYTYRIYI